MKNPASSLRLALSSLVIILTVASANAQPRRAKNPPPPPPLAEAAAPVAPMNHPGPMAPPPADQVASSAVVVSPVLERQAEVRPAFRFGGFADLELALFNKSQFPSQGFTLNDAALYLDKDFGRGFSASADLPFQTPDGTGAAASTTSAFAFASGKAQGYAQYLNAGFAAKFGQWDTIYGVERNDSRDRFFLDPGTIKSNFVPATHTGLLLSYSVPMVTFRGLVANPHDTGSMSQQNPELGVQARFDMNGFYAAAGFLYNDVKAAAGATSPGSNMLIDVMAGLAMDRFNASIYFDDRKQVGLDKHGTGFGVLSSFAIDPDLGVGARVEYGGDPTTAAGAVKSILDFAAGPSYRLSPEFTIRGDLSIQAIDFAPTNVEDITFFGGRFSVLAQF